MSSDEYTPTKVSLKEKKGKEDSKEAVYESKLKKSGIEIMTRHTAYKNLFFYPDDFVQSVLVDVDKKKTYYIDIFKKANNVLHKTR